MGFFCIDCTYGVEEAKMERLGVKIVHFLRDRNLECTPS